MQIAIMFMQTHFYFLIKNLTTFNTLTKQQREQNFGPVSDIYSAQPGDGFRILNITFIRSGLTRYIKREFKISGGLGGGREKIGHL